MLWKKGTLFLTIPFFPTFKNLVAKSILWNLDLIVKLRLLTTHHRHATNS